MVMEQIEQIAEKQDEPVTVGQLNSIVIEIFIVMGALFESVQKEVQENRPAGYSLRLGDLHLEVSCADSKLEERMMAIREEAVKFIDILKDRGHTEDVKKIDTKVGYA